MIVPAARQDQQRLFPLEDKPMTSLAQRRVYVGEFFEKATQALFRAERLLCVTNADICPDLICNGRYLENKSIGKSGELIVRKQQLDREKEFVQGREVSYVLWRHDAPVIEAPTRDSLYTMLAKHAKEVVVVCAHKIHALAEAKPLIKWTQLGQTPEKCQGHRIRWKDLTSTLHGVQDTIIWRVSVEQHAIGPITLRCPDKMLRKACHD